MAFLSSAAMSSHEARGVGSWGAGPTGRFLPGGLFRAVATPNNSKALQSPAGHRSCSNLATTARSRVLPSVNDKQRGRERGGERPLWLKSEPTPGLSQTRNTLVRERQRERERERASSPPTGATASGWALVRGLPSVHHGPQKST